MNFLYRGPAQLNDYTFFNYFSRRPTVRPGETVHSDPNVFHPNHHSSRGTYQEPEEYHTCSCCNYF